MKRTPAYPRRERTQYYGCLTLQIEDDNDLYFDIRKEKVVSSDSDFSDIKLPVIEITKHRRKWLRKCLRPNRKMANQVKSKYARTRMRYDNIQKANFKSQLENKQQLVNKSHNSRLNTLTAMI